MRRAALLYGLLAGIVFAPFLLTGQVFVPGDFLSFIYPWRAYQSGFPHNVELFDVAVFFFPQDIFLNESLKNGVLPYWNPHIFSGHPTIASGQSGFLYPPRIALNWLFSAGVAKTWLQLLHYFGLGITMYWFLREVRFSRYAATLGGLVWMSNSHMSAWLEFEHVVITGMYVPLLLLTFERGLNRDKRWWLLMPLFGALSLHSGHLQSNLYAGSIVICYVAARLASQKRWKEILPFFGIGVLTVGLAAPTVLPFLEFLQQSQRPPLVPGDNAASLWSLTLSLLSPDLFGNPTKGFLINRCASNLMYSEFACFVGTLPLVYALAAKGRTARMLQVASILCLLVASATVSLPLLSRFVPGRVLYFLMFCLTYLAALGAEQNKDNFKALRTVCAGLAVIWLPVWGYLVYLLNHPEKIVAWRKAEPGWVKLPPLNVEESVLINAFHDTYAWNPQLILPLVILGLTALFPARKWFLLVLTALELGLFTFGFNTSVPPDTLFPWTPELEAMKETDGRVVSVRCANYNTLVPYDFSLVNGYESLVDKRYLTALQQTEPQRPLPMRSLAFERLDLPMVDALGIEYALVPPGRKVQAPGWVQVMEGEGGTVFQNEEALPRATLIGKVGPLQDPRQLQTFDPATFAFVSAAPPSELQPGQGSVRWLGETPNRLDLVVETETTQLLLVTDSYHPGWKATVDGDKVPVFWVNLASRGIYLQPGTHRVTFRFQPTILTWSWRYFWFSALVILIFASVVGRRPETATEETSSP